MKKSPYSDTPVPVAQSKESIERLLRKYGVVAHRFTSFPVYGQVDFVRKTKEGGHLSYRITVKPRIDRLARSAEKELERAERQAWRVVYWWFKSKMEALDFGLVEFEQEFLPYMLVRPPGESRDRTVTEVLFERLAGATALPGDPFGGLQPPMLPEGRDDRSLSGR